MTQFATAAAAAAPMMPPMTPGLDRGTQVYTLRGAVPVERLRTGDHVITRSGAAILRNLIRKAGDAFALDFDRPQIVLLDRGQIHSDTCLPYAA
ncbi:MAG: Hint domain-containing protein [Rhodobacter sp.]|nr:Hint domain-containing protein [Rhodobacter sp.]